MVTLAVVATSESFADLWPALAAEAGARPVVVGDVDDFMVLPGPHVAILACAGREESAASDIRVMRRRSDAPIAVVGSEASHRVAVTAVAAGANTYFALPGDHMLLRRWVVEQIAAAALLAGSARNERLRDRYDFSPILGRSQKLQSSLEVAAKVIPHGATTVLILGETGTGKELVARSIHDNGPRSGGPFVEINCATLPQALVEAEMFGHVAGAFTDARVSKPGLFELASGGTLFLDEIGDLSLDAQAKVLRALEQRTIRRVGGVKDIPIDIRLIAATRVDLATAVGDGRFRDDLFYRINVVPVILPPLRQRGEDVLLLAEYFLTAFSQKSGMPRPRLAPADRRRLREHHWPGNVRELRNLMERAVVVGPEALKDMPASAGNGSRGTGPLPFPASLATINEAAARAMVDTFGGNKSAAAAALGIGRKRLYTLLRRYRNETAPEEGQGAVGVTISHTETTDVSKGPGSSP